MSDHEPNGAPISGPEPNTPPQHHQQASPKPLDGPSSMTMTVRMVVEVSDPMALAAYLLVGHDNHSGELSIVPAGALHDDAAIVAVEYLREAFASSTTYTGLTLRSIETIGSPQRRSTA